MMDSFYSQWIFLPLWLICNVVVALSILGMLGYMLVAVFRGVRTSPTDESANTPNLPFKAMDMSWARRSKRTPKP